MTNRKRNRLRGYDYSQDNLYFVTNCVKGMVCCLGEIVPIASAAESNEIDLSKSNKIMVLNKYGEIVRDRLLWLTVQYPYVVLVNYVVMPNHVHAIIKIESLRVTNVAIKIKSLSSLCGAFKTTSSKLIYQAGCSDFAWHRFFHDHIIRNDKSFCNISNCIDQNPSNWKSDRFFG